MIRRGPRPLSTSTTFGRVGEVGKRALDKEASSQISIRELVLHDEHKPFLPIMEGSNSVSEDSVGVEIDRMAPKNQAELQEILRLEAFSWPRLVFPPLKKSGHIILDSCTAEGKIS